MPGFGRKHAPDERDRGFLMRRRTRRKAGEPRKLRKSYSINGRNLDQADTGTCVGHGWKNFLRCAPMRTEKSGPSAFDIYRDAVILDTWSENDDEHALADFDAGLDFGTSVRAGAEAVTKTGRLKSYLWEFELQPAIDYFLDDDVGHPIVLGTNWYPGMMRPDKEGIVRIGPNDRAEAGHCYLWRKLDLRRGLAGGTNSWGDDWGLSGDFWIPLEHLERLIHEDGECCTATEQKLEAKQTTPPPQTAAA